MKLSGSQTLTANITLTGGTYTFAGALPSEIAYLSGVTSAIQTQINSCNSNLSSTNTTIQSQISNLISTLAPKASPTFTGTVSIPGATCTAVLNFPSAMTVSYTHLTLPTNREV